MRKTVQAGFAFTGEISSAAFINEENGPRRVYCTTGRQPGDPLSGQLSGSVAAPFQASARVELADGLYELFHGDARTMERLAFPAGANVPPLDSAEQLLFTLNFDELAMSVETLATRAEAGGEATVGDVKCRRLDLALPNSAIPAVVSFDKDPGDVDRTVDLTTWVGNDDGQVHRLQAVFRYRPKFLRKGSKEFSRDIDFNLTLQRHGAAKVDIPPDMKAACAAPETAPAQGAQRPHTKMWPLEAGLDKDVTVQTARALRKTAQGGFTFAGEGISTLGQEWTLRPTFAGKPTAVGNPLTGKLSGTVEVPFRVSARVTSADGCYELSSEGARLTERLAWPAGAISPPFEAAGQFLFLLNLEDMARSVEALATKAEAVGESMVGDVKCREFDLALPGHAIRIVTPSSFAPDRTVDIAAWVGIEDGQVHRLQVMFHYKKTKSDWMQRFTGDVSLDMTLQKKGAVEARQE